MTYRLPGTLPYLAALLSAVFVLGLFFAPSRVSPFGYVLVIAFALVILTCGVLSRRYAVTVTADRLVISSFQRREYLFAHMSSLELVPGKGVWIAVITMNDGTRVSVDGSLRNFAGFVHDLASSAKLPLPASNLR
jgi:hypothetical protein